jgi:hypothetical protein
MSTRVKPTKINPLPVPENLLKILCLKDIELYRTSVQGHTQMADYIMQFCSIPYRCPTPLHQGSSRQPGLPVTEKSSVIRAVARILCLLRVYLIVSLRVFEAKGK